jgi:hypothetical protein
MRFRQNVTRALVLAFGIAIVVIWYKSREESSNGPESTADLAQDWADRPSQNLENPAETTRPSIAANIQFPDPRQASSLTPAESSVNDRRVALSDQQRLDMEMFYPKLGESLGLSEAEADRFFEILAESQRRLGRELLAAGFRGTMSPETTQIVQNHERLQNEAVLELLGSEKSLQWQAFRHTRGARVEAAFLATELARSGQPLTRDQQGALLASMLEDQKSRVQEPTTSALPGRITQRMLDAASGTLTAEQLAILKGKLDLQSATLPSQSSDSLGQVSP